MKLISWNVNGIRAAAKKGFVEFIEKEQPDILCLQETKAEKEQVPPSVHSPGGYYSYFSSSRTKKGYSGVANFYKELLDPGQTEMDLAGENTEPFNQEGRFIISRHEAFTLYNIYFPSGSSGDARQGFKYKFLDTLLEHIQTLPKTERDKLIICGDYNICHKEIDIHHPDKATKQEMSGFLPEERTWMDHLCEQGFIDSFRHVHGDITDSYSWWSYRANAREKNLGWRIDYIFVAEALKSGIKDAQIHNTTLGSDHCPISVEISL